MRTILFTAVLSICAHYLFACSCAPGMGFCQGFSGNQPVLCIPIQIDSISVTVKVLDAWGNNSVGDTVTVWDDSLLVMNSKMTQDHVYRYECVIDVKDGFDIGDTILLMLRDNYAGSGFGAPTDYLFDMEICRTGFLPVQNDSVKDYYWDQVNWQGQPAKVLHQPVDSLRYIYENELSCADFYTVGISNKTEILPEVKIFPTGFQLTGNGQTVLANVYNVAGQQMWQRKVEPNTLQQPALQPGLYIITLSGTDGQMVSYKWYKE